MSIFGDPAKGVRQQQRLQARATKKAIGKSAEYITQALPGSLQALSSGGTAVGQALSGATSTGSGLGINITPGINGGPASVNTTQSPELTSLLDRLKSGSLSAEGKYNDLLSQLKPGFGAITQARRNAILNQFQSDYGNLKDSLAQRRISGSSFANDTLGRASADLRDQLAQSDAQSFLDELSATTQLIQQQSAQRLADIQTGLNEANLDTATRAELLSTFQNAQLQQAQLQADLAKTSATLQLNAGIAKSGNATSLSGAQIGSYPEFSNQINQAQAGQGQLFGSLVGNALFGGGFGSTGSSSLASIAGPALLSLV